MKVIWYTFKEIVLPFLGGVFFFTFVFLMFQAVRLADYFVNHGVGLFLLLKMVVYVSAAFLPVVLPMSFLVAVLVGFGRMSADSEIVALKASGFSIHKLALPVVASSVLVSLAVSYLAFFFIPWANYEFKKTVLKIGNTKVVSNLKEGTFTEGFFDLLVYADRVNTDDNEMLRVFIHDERNPQSPSVVVAEKGTILPQKTDSELSAAVVLRLFAGSIHRPEATRAFYEKIDFNEYNLLLKVDEGQSGEISYPKTRTQLQLRDDMARYTAEGNRNLYVEYSIEFWRRIALGFVPLIFGFLGIGLGTVRMRSVKSNAMLVCVGIVFFYWAFNLLGATLAERFILHPFFAIQAANLILIPVAAYFYRKAMW